MAEIPCPHAIPQAASQLHGVCIFCYRDRLGEARAEVERLRPVLAAAEAILGYSQTGSDAVFIDWDRYFNALHRAVKAAKEE